MATARETTPWGAYAPGQAWDEAMDVEGDVRDPYAKVYREIEGMSREDLYSRAEALANTYLAQGVTFDHAGEERPVPPRHRPPRRRARTTGRSSARASPSA